MDAQKSTFDNQYFNFLDNFDAVALECRES